MGEYVEKRFCDEIKVMRICRHNPHTRSTATQPLWRQTKTTHSREVKAKNLSLTLPPNHFVQGIMYLLGRKPNVVTYYMTMECVYGKYKKCISQLPHLKKSLSR